MYCTVFWKVTHAKQKTYSYTKKLLKKCGLAHQVTDEFAKLLLGWSGHIWHQKIYIFLPLNQINMFAYLISLISIIALAFILQTLS